MKYLLSLVAGLVASIGDVGVAARRQLLQNPIEIYGTWHCGSDYCTWGTVRDMTEFDAKNHWIINRSDGVPSVNLVVLSFVDPLKLLHKTTDAQTLNGVPRGMTQEIVNYFKVRHIRVMLSIGGITYVKFWNEALGTNATELGLNAAEVAQRLGVGIEIDYEENRDPNLLGLQAFINAYRSVIPYDPTGGDHEARLTIDVAAGDRWLIDIVRKATEDWLKTDVPVLDYANAMVTARPYRKPTDAIKWWQEHVDGKPQFDPPIPPLAPAKFTGSLWLTGNKGSANCVNFDESLQQATADFVRTVEPHPSLTPLATAGMLGFMFWSAECQGTRSLCTTPEDGSTCEGGMGVASSIFNIPIPMAALRQN